MPKVSDLPEALTIALTDDLYAVVGGNSRRVKPSTLSSALTGKQDALVSGTNIKTVGGESLLGSGDIPFPAPPPPASTEIYGVLQAPYVLTSATAQQRLFNWSANGAVTLETGVYSFEIGFLITGMSATSGNAQFGILGAGTATLATYRVGGVTGEVSAITGNASFLTTGAPNAAAGIAVAGTATQLMANLFGTFDVTAPGTLIPSISLTTAAAASVSTGSFFRCRKIGETGVATGGAWS